MMPPPALGKLRFGALQQPRSREHIGEVHGLRMLGVDADARLMLPRMDGGTTIYQGRPRGRSYGYVITSSYQSKRAFLRILQIPFRQAFPALAVK